MSGQPNTKPQANTTEENDEEDNATVVLDLNKLKEEMNKKNDLSDAAVDLEFIAGPDDPKTESIPSFKVVMFEYGEPLFEESKTLLPEGFNYIISRDVKELSQLLKSPEFQIVMFYYNGDPKAVNTLCSQVKAKFPKTKTIIVAKNLSPDKVKIHQNSPSGANEYINLPFEKEKVKDLFLKIHKNQ